VGAGALPELGELTRATSAWPTLLLFALEAALFHYALAHSSALPGASRRGLAVGLALASIALTWLAPHLERFTPAAELVLALGVGLCAGQLARSLWTRFAAPRAPLRDPALTPFL
jgi:hypothetical protein